MKPRRQIAGIRGSSLPGPPHIMEGTPRSWSDIPLELAGLVLSCLPAHIDRVRFAAVCTHWRYARQQVSLPPPLPLLAVKDGTFYSMPRGEPVHFPGCDGGFATACGNWLVYNHLHCLLLVDPFSHATITLPAPPRVGVPHNNDGDDVPNDGDDVPNLVVVKLILCSPHLIAALFQGGYRFWIAVCRPGASSWSVARKLPMWIYDIAFYQEKLYAVSYLNDLVAINICVDDITADPQVVQIEMVIKGGFINLDARFWRVLYLIESRGSLLMVRRRMLHGQVHYQGQIHTFAEQCEPELEVLEADFGQSQWTKVMTLGDDDQALFLGLCSRAVCMPQCDLQDKRVWLLDDYKRDDEPECTESSANDVALSKFSCPLPMISWEGRNGCAGATWIFPSD